jgi:23S rRNA-/tRNA-specific pseudouridylate synthase
MSVHGGAGEEGPTLIDLLRAAYRDVVDLHLVHRLDRATSGLMVIAKSKAIARQVNRAWDSAEKRYLAVALGLVDRSMSIDVPLEDRYGKKKAAETQLSVIAPLDRIEPPATLVELVLGTGRTHQIRLHLRKIGHPVLMDDKHGDFRANKAWARAAQGRGANRPKHLMLHSWRLRIRHPARADAVGLAAKPPSWWAELLEIAGGVVDAFDEVP